MGIDTPKVNSDVPEAEAKAEGQKLEWGPDLGEMSWNEAQKAIEVYNVSSLVGEERQRPWRLPTKDELVAESRKLNSKAGLVSGYYLTSTIDLDDGRFAYTVNTGYGIVESIDKNFAGGYARLVRDVA